MRILFISEYFFPAIQGGGELSAYYLAKHLAEQGEEVHVLTSRFKGLTEEELLDGIHFHRLLQTGKNPRSFFSNIKRLFYPGSVQKNLRQLCAQYSFDIIHCMNMTSLSAVREKKGISAAFIAHVNSPLFLWPSGILTQENIKEQPTFSNFVRDLLSAKQIGRLNYPSIVRYNPFAWWVIYQKFQKLRNNLTQFDAWVGISPFITEKLMQQGFPRQKIFVLPNIIPLDPFLTQPMQSYTPPRILYLGQFEQFKGPHILLEALAKIKIPYTCSLYGSGSLQTALQEFIVREKLLATLRPDVAYSKVPQIVAQHDLVVFPSLVADAFGRVIVEAMAAGKPVIASRIGGMQHIIIDKKTGFLFTPGDTDELMQKISLLLKNAALRKKMGEQGRMAAKEYDPLNITNEMIRIYGKVRHAGKDRKNNKRH